MTLETCLIGTQALISYCLWFLVKLATCKDSQFATGICRLSSLNEEVSDALYPSFDNSITRHRSVCNAFRY